MIWFIALSTIAAAVLACKNFKTQVNHILNSCCQQVFIFRSVRRVDNIFFRLPYDKDLQDLFRYVTYQLPTCLIPMQSTYTSCAKDGGGAHCKDSSSFLPISDMSQQWVLGEVDPDHLADLYGMDEQVLS